MATRLDLGEVDVEIGDVPSVPDPPVVRRRGYSRPSARFGRLSAARSRCGQLLAALRRHAQAVVVRALPDGATHVERLTTSTASIDASICAKGDAITYAYANAAVSYLVETFGEKTFWNFYRDFKKYEPAGSQEAHPLEETRADATHRLLCRIYDMNEEQLDEKTREYIKKALS
ncbi:MAG: hypothetical protein M3P85_00275 [Actinomycetota bacterium]|nr:hypothetical protein [Actinomycetota bacterium]